MIHVAIYANGLLHLQADTEIEAFALGEWERRKKMGKAMLHIDVSVRQRIDPPANRHRAGAWSSERFKRIEQLLRENGPLKAKSIAEHIGVAIQTAYMDLTKGRDAGLVVNKHGVWALVENAAVASGASVK